jgi:hypothetical protein
VDEVGGALKVQQGEHWTARGHTDRLAPPETAQLTLLAE